MREQEVAIFDNSEAEHLQWCKDRALHKIETLDRWRRSPPKRDGLWLTRERERGGLGYLVLVIDGYVAGDDDLCAVLGVNKVREDFNYFDGVSVQEITTKYNNEWYFIGNRWREIYGAGNLKP